MALRELPSIGSLSRLLTRQTQTRPRASLPSISAARSTRCYASAAEVRQERSASEDLQELESESSFASTAELSEKIGAFDPVKTAQRRQSQLPPSRYQYKPPVYYRGPLHPYQPPPASDPASRQFVPGPFSYTRLEHTYQSTIAPDLMTLGYTHVVPGTVKTEKADRLRTWDGSSPYHKGRPKRGPRGPGEKLPIREIDIDWKNIPKIEEVTVHCMVKGAIENSSHLHVAGMMLQAITGVRPVVHRAKHSVAQFGIRENMPVSLTCTMRGNQAFDFVDKCIHLVCPGIKDWPGVKGSTGDSSGNIAFGFDREGAILFPEVSVNYDMYPPKLIPGFHVVVKTTATSDRHARLLMSAMGMPFYGKLID